MKMTKANDWIVKKFKKLYELIHNDIPNSDNMPVTESEEDKLWVWDRMCDYDGGIVPEKSELVKANTLWKKYKDGVDCDPWYTIDSYIKDGRLIEAIKEYRSFHNSSLIESQEAIDTRKYGLNNGWDV